MEDQQFDLCMERILQGEKDALRDIYDVYLGYIYHLILGIVGNREDAEDITSEFFIKLWNIADKYQPGSGHKTWMSFIARNMAIDYLRAHKKEIVSDFTDEMTETLEVKQQDNLYESPVETETIEGMNVKEILDTLNPAQREIVHMKVIADMTFQEIASATGLPMGTVTWRYREAIKKLRRYGYESRF